MQKKKDFSAMGYCEECFEIFDFDQAWLQSSMRKHFICEFETLREVGETKVAFE